MVPDSPLLLGRSWEHYRAALLSAETDDRTIAALRHAFYVGAMVVHMAMVGISERRISEDDAVILLHIIGNEVDAILAEYAAGSRRES